MFVVEEEIIVGRGYEESEGSGGNKGGVSEYISGYGVDVFGNLRLSFAVLPRSIAL